MTQCKQRLKNAAMLRNLQQPDGVPELKPIVHNKLDCLVSMTCLMALLQLEIS